MDRPRQGDVHQTDPFGLIHFALAILTLDRIGGGESKIENNLALIVAVFDGQGS